LWWCGAFFFSSRRRHTRFSRDWSSDVCSSDLERREDKRKQKEERKSYALSDVPSRSAFGTQRKEGKPERGRGYGRGYSRTFKNQIGRASCRERVEISRVAVDMKRTKKREDIR